MNASIIKKYSKDILFAISIIIGVHFACEFIEGGAALTKGMYQEEIGFVSLIFGFVLLTQIVVLVGKYIWMKVKNNDPRRSELYGYAPEKDGMKGSCGYKVDMSKLPKDGSGVSRKL